MGWMDRFKIKARKAASGSAPDLLPYGGYGAPKWSSTDGETMIREGYNSIVWVYAAVDTIASCVASVPWELYITKSNGEEEQVEDHPLLRMLNGRVAPYFSSRYFFKLWATDLATQGRFFAHLNNHALPTSMIPLYAHKTKPIPDKLKFVSGFEHCANTIDTYRPEDILWSRFVDPLDYYEGLTPIRAAARTLDTENEAISWNKKQLENMGVPPGVLSVINAGPGMADKLRSEWRKRIAGPKNARLPLVVDGERVQYTPMAINAVDMDFIEQRKLSRVEIAAVFGVPSQCIGIPDAQQYANYSEAVKALWQQTVIPKYLDHIKDDLQERVVSPYGDRLVLKYCLDDITVLHESTDAIHERAREDYKYGILTKNEAREAINYDAAEDESGEEFFSAAPPSTPTETTASQTTATTVQVPREMAEKALAEVERTKTQREEGIRKALNAMAWLSAVEAARSDMEPRIKSMWEDVFTRERAAVLDALPGDRDGMETRATMALVDKNAEVQAMYRAVIERFAEMTYREVGRRFKDDTVDLWQNTPEVDQYIQTVSATQVQMINETTRQQIRGILSSAAPVASVEDIAEGIDRLYLQQIIPNRSTVIARTEIIGASNFGSLSGAKQAAANYGVEGIGKLWISTGDARTRPSHKDADGQVVPLEGNFIIGGSGMAYPGDPSGPSEEVIQCRCALGYDFL